MRSRAHLEAHPLALLLVGVDSVAALRGDVREPEEAAERLVEIGLAAPAGVDPDAAPSTWWR